MNLMPSTGPSASFLIPHWNPQKTAGIEFGKFHPKMGKGVSLWCFFENKVFS